MPQGLSGLLAARFAGEVWLTDKDDQVLELLSRSVQLGPAGGLRGPFSPILILIKKNLADVRGRVKVEKLTWGNEDQQALFPHFDVILASDSLYCANPADTSSLHRYTGTIYQQWSPCGKQWTPFFREVAVLMNRLQSSSWLMLVVRS